MLKKVVYAASVLLVVSLAAVTAQNTVSDGAPRADVIEKIQKETEISQMRLQRAESDMNRAYAQLSNKLSDNRKQKLNEWQKAWMAYRDKQASFYADAMPDERKQAVYNDEATIMTKARTAELQQIFH